MSKPNRKVFTKPYDLDIDNIMEDLMGPLGRLRDSCRLTTSLAKNGVITMREIDILAQKAMNMFSDPEVLKVLHEIRMLISKEGASAEATL